MYSVPQPRQSLPLSQSQFLSFKHPNLLTSLLMVSMLTMILGSFLSVLEMHLWLKMISNMLVQRVFKKLSLFLLV